MALIVRPTTDLVSLYDNGLIGEEGALRALIHVTRPIHRLDLSHNLLGDGGAATLVQGLTSLRGRYSSPEAGIWGLSEINLIHNELGDAGMDAVLGYVKKDVMMRRVYLQSNSITLSSNLDSILNSIASSRLSLLFLNSNAPTPSGIEQFFSRLDAPHLQILHLSRCNIGYPSAKPIAAFLASSRSRNLLELQLNANSLGYQGVKELVDTIASHNYTIELLGLAANDPAPARRRDSFGDAVEGSAANEGDEPEENVMPNEAALREAELDRLSTLLARNRGYTRRVQKAAARCIAPARILLNAKPAPEPSPLYIARQVISDVSQVAHAFFQPSSAPWLLEKPFPFLDLPPEIRYQIVRHTSMDPLALSDGQFARLRAEAEDREALRRLGDVMQTAIRREREDVRAAVRGVRDEWLRRNWWNKWDCEVAS